MSFLGMGTFEILVILLVAFIFLGPERMIDAARTLGKWTGELRRMGSTVQAEMDDLTNVGAPLTSRYDQAQYDRRTDLNARPLDQDHPQDHPMEASDPADAGERRPGAADTNSGGTSNVSSSSKDEAQSSRKEEDS